MISYKSSMHTKALSVIFSEIQMIFVQMYRGGAIGSRRGIGCGCGDKYIWNLFPSKDRTHHQNLKVIHALVAKLWPPDSAKFEAHSISRFWAAILVNV